MTLHVRCECMWNADTKQLSARDPDCPIHSSVKSKPLAGIYGNLGQPFNT